MNWKAIQEQQDRCDSLLLEDQMKWFFERWQPANRQDSAEFHMHFTRLVQSIYMEAQKPYNALVTAAISLIPNPLLVNPLVAPMTRKEDR